MLNKGFRAALPIQAYEAERLRKWSEANCLDTNVICEGGEYIWTAKRERARTREAFMRAVRGILKKLAICTSRLRGRWLILSFDDTIEAHPPTTSMPPAPAPTSEEDDARVILLSVPRCPHKGATRSAIHVDKI